LNSKKIFFLKKSKIEPNFQKESIQPPYWLLLYLQDVIPRWNHYRDMCFGKHSQIAMQRFYIWAFRCTRWRINLDHQPLHGNTSGYGIWQPSHKSTKPALPNSVLVIPQNTSFVKVYFQPIKNRVSQLILLDRYYIGIFNRLNQENSRLKYWEKYRNVELWFKSRTM